MGLVIDGAAYSYIGGRKNNEDNFYLNGVYMERGRMDQGGQCDAVFSGHTQIYAVCDGMGGAMFGEEASLLAVSELRNYQAECIRPCDPELLSQTLRNISDGINRISYSRGMQAGTSGSTIAMIVTEGTGFRTVHIGDSRIYRLRKGELERLTKDHSLVQQLLDAGKITQEAAFRHHMKNVITQHLGMPDEPHEMTPSISPVMQLRPGDRFLICSDGVSDMIPDAEIGRIIEQSDTPIGSAAALVRAALREAYDRGENADNITLIRLDVRESEGSIHKSKDVLSLIKRVFGRRN